MLGGLFASRPRHEDTYGMTCFVLRPVCVNESASRDRDYGLANRYLPAPWVLLRSRLNAFLLLVFAIWGGLFTYRPRHEDTYGMTFLFSV